MAVIRCDWRDVEEIVCEEAGNAHAAAAPLPAHSVFRKKAEVIR